MLPIRNISYLSSMCCNFWENCINSHKIGQGCRTTLIKFSLITVLFLSLLCFFFFITSFCFVSFVCLLFDIEMPLSMVVIIVVYYCCCVVIYAFVLVCLFSQLSTGSIQSLSVCWVQLLWLTQRYVWLHRWCFCTANVRQPDDRIRNLLSAYWTVCGDQGRRWHHHFTSLRCASVWVWGL